MQAENERGVLTKSTVVFVSNHTQQAAVCSGAELLCGLMLLNNSQDAEQASTHSTWQQSKHRRSPSRFVRGT